MKNKVFDKTFFDNSFSSARMRPYYNRYPGKEKASHHYAPLPSFCSVNNHICKNRMQTKMTLNTVVRQRRMLKKLEE